MIHATFVVRSMFDEYIIHVDGHTMKNQYRPYDAPKFVPGESVTIMDIIRFSGVEGHGAIALNREWISKEMCDTPVENLPTFINNGKNFLNVVFKCG